MIKVTKDARTIRTGRDYTLFRKDIYDFQDGKCYQCYRETLLSADLEANYSFHTHHENGRGLGGSKRDDTLNSCVGLCGECHRKDHGQQEAVKSQPQWSRK